MYGDFNTGNARLLFLSFEKCDNTKRDTCKPDEEVKEWLDSQYLVFAYNKYNFVEDAFKERALKTSASLDWVPIDINSRKLTPYKV